MILLQHTARDIFQGFNHTHFSSSVSYTDIFYVLIIIFQVLVIHISHVQLYLFQAQLYTFSHFNHTHFSHTPFRIINQTPFSRFSYKHFSSSVIHVLHVLVICILFNHTPFYVNHTFSSLNNRYFHILIIHIFYILIIYYISIIHIKLILQQTAPDTKKD